MDETIHFTNWLPSLYLLKIEGRHNIILLHSKVQGLQINLHPYYHISRYRFPLGKALDFINQIKVCTRNTV